MTYLVSEPLDTILKQYPYKVNKIHLQSYKKDRAVWWIHTNKGLKILKKLPCHENRLKFILEGIIHLQSKGVNIPRIYETVNKKLYVNLDGICYMLMEAIGGTRPLYGDKDELKTVITAMGEFHRASYGFNPPSECDISSHLGKCSKLYTRKYNILKDYYNKESKKTLHTSFGDTAKRELPYFFKRIENIQTELPKSKYSSWVKKISRSGGLSHFDFASWNLIITPANKLYIFDFDSLSMDLPMWDIRILFFDIMKHFKPFTKQNLKVILNLYQNANPLTVDEWHIVKLNLLYPHKVFQIIKRYINKQKNWSEDKYALELKRAITREKLMIRNLKGYEHIIDRFDLLSK